MKPYIPGLLQSLHDGDADTRLEFCKTFLYKVNEDKTFLDKSDETTFKLNGQINRYNCVYCSDFNPYVILKKDVRQPRVRLWVSIS